MDKRVRLLLAALALILVSAIIYTVKVYTDASRKLSNSSANPVGEYSNYSVFYSDNGLFGIRESVRNGFGGTDVVIVAEPQWAYLKALGNGVFMAQSNPEMLFGIIDFNGNIIVPMIYPKMDYSVSGILTACDDSGMYTFFSSDGRPAFEKRVNDYSIEENKYVLKSGFDTYYATCDNGRLNVTNCTLMRNICGKPSTVEINVTQKVNGVSYRDYIELVDTALTYVQGLYENSPADVLSVTRPEYYSTVIEDNILASKNITQVSYFAVSISGKEGSIQNTASFNFVFEDPNIENSLYESNLTVLLERADSEYIVYEKRFADIRIYEKP